MIRTKAKTKCGVIRRPAPAFVVPPPGVRGSCSGEHTTNQGLRPGRNDPAGALAFVRIVEKKPGWARGKRLDKCWWCLDN